MESKKTPYWLRDPDPLDSERHLRELKQLQELHNAKPPAKMSPNPLARTWHDT